MQYKTAQTRVRRFHKEEAPLPSADAGRFRQFRRLRLALLTAGIGSLFLLLLKNPAVTASAALDGLLLAVKTVLPSTFPYMILSQLLLSCGAADAIGKALGPMTRRLFFLPPVCAAVILMGAVSGFPVGASCAASLYLSGRCKKEEAERMLCFCNFCGPPFILGGVAGFLNHSGAGLAIFLAQTAVMFSLGILLGIGARRRSRKSAVSAAGTADKTPQGKISPDKAAYRGGISGGTSPAERKALPSVPRAGDPGMSNDTLKNGTARGGAQKEKKKSFSLLFYEAVKGACLSMLQIIGFIVFFSILGDLLEKISDLLPKTDGISPDALLLPVLRGVLEISGGTRAAAAAGLAIGKGNVGYAVFFCALATAWSGASVHMQVASFALPAGLSMKKYFRYRLPASLCTALLSLLLVDIFGII